MTVLSDLLAQRSDAQRKRVSVRSGVSLERLSALARGHEPSFSELRRLAAPLKVALEDLLPVADAEAATVLLFRRSMGPNAKLPISVSHLARRVASSFSLSSSRPAARVLAWRSEFLQPEDSLRNAEANAAIFREVFFSNDQLSPITTLPAVATDRMGVFVYVVNSADIDGASALVDNSAFAFVSAKFVGRMLFTLAHELGHLIAHHGDEQFALVDRDIEAAPSGDDRVREAYANAFASALLMPSQSVGLALKAVRRAGKSESDQLGDTEINYLARIYGVSFWAAARRCEDLQLLPRGGAQALNARLIEAHGSAEQRANELGLPPRPEISFPKVPWPLVESAVANIRAGEMSVGKAASSLGVSIADLFSANAPTMH